MTDKHDSAASKVFCVLPWIHSYIATDGQAALCCQSSHPLPALNGEPLNIQRHSFAEIFHSPAMDAVRRQMLDGKPLAACGACYTAERIGVSPRQDWNKHWAEKLPELMAIIRERGEKAAFDKPASIDIRFGNLCNLRCQICNGHNSSQAERDAVLSKWNTIAMQRVDGSRFGAEEWHDAPAYESELAEFTSELRYITLGGGEPSISKPAMRWLEGLVESGQAAKIELRISTNLTNVNPRFFNLAAQFGETRFLLSIDGFGPLNEYLRYPSKWRTVESNADHLAKLAQRGNTTVCITPVINAYNALSIAHLFEWADARGFDIIARRVRAVDQIDGALLPAATRALAVQRMRDFLKTARNPTPWYDTIEEVCRYLELPEDAAFTDACREKFHHFTREIDASRGMRFDLYNPETAAALGYVSGLNSFDAE